MKIICNTAALTEVCSNIQRFVPAKAVTPHLEGILIRTTENSSIELCGYDLEIGVSAFMEARIEEQGGVILNAKTLCDILRHMPSDRVNIDCNERNICTISGGSAEYTIVSIPYTEYPELPRITDETIINVRQLVLREMVRQTIFAVSVDDSKAVHRGVKFEITNGEIKLIALDGYRLAIRKEFIEYNGEGTVSFIVPSKTLSELVKLINEEDGFINISLGKRHIIFTVNGYNIISRLLEGEFLDYKSAIPDAKSTCVRVNTKVLTECIERASIIITEKTRSPLKFVFENNEIRISAVTALGSASDKLEASIDGKRAELGFNNRFLTDALRSCDTDEILIDINGPISPVLLLPPEGDSFLYLILPVRLKNEEK